MFALSDYVLSLSWWYAEQEWKPIDGARAAISIGAQPAVIVPAALHQAAVDIVYTAQAQAAASAEDLPFAAIAVPAKPQANAVISCRLLDAVINTAIPLQAAVVADLSIEARKSVVMAPAASAVIFSDEAQAACALPAQLQAAVIGDPLE